MTETVIKIKKKEKKKQLSIFEAIEILKPFVKQWKRQDEDMAYKMYEIYKQCKWGDWKKVLDGLGFPTRTWYDWAEHFNFDLNFPQMSEGREKNAKSQSLDDGIGAEPQQIFDEDEIEVEITPAEYEDEITSEFDTAKYQETYSILDKAAHLSKNQFNVVEKKELIEKLQKTIAKLNGLLVELESS